jgi:hypothetical protein
MVMRDGGYRPGSVSVSRKYTMMGRVRSQFGPADDSLACRGGFALVDFWSSSRPVQIGVEDTAVVNGFVASSSMVSEGTHADHQGPSPAHRSARR